MSCSIPFWTLVLALVLLTLLAIGLAATWWLRPIPGGA